MARSYYSTVFEKSVGEIWPIIRDFSNYAIWVNGNAESQIENGKSGDSAGAVRKVRLGEKVIRQRLLASSDRDRYYTYEFCKPIPCPVKNYEATVRLTPIVDGNQAFAEWWATFDCAVEELDYWTEFYASSFSKWFESLRGALTTTEGCMN
jgi:Polyketide cyclase / dehydrase and lipid transport